MNLICSAFREIVESAITSWALEVERALRELLNHPDGSASSSSFRPPYDSGPYDSARLHKSFGVGTRDLMHIAGSYRRQLPSYITPSCGVNLDELPPVPRSFPNGAVKRAVLAAIDGAASLSAFDLALSRVTI